MADEGLKSIGGLWLKDGKKGKYFSGEVELFGTKQHILVFKNDKGDNERRPDYRIYVPNDETEEKDTHARDNEVPF